MYDMWKLLPTNNVEIGDGLLTNLLNYFILCLQKTTINNNYFFMIIGLYLKKHILVKLYLYFKNLIALLSVLKSSAISIFLFFN